MRKVLVISYFFPPSGGVKVQRVLKFVKYLPPFGWEPIVVTVKHPQRDFTDPELLREVPLGTRVKRTFSFEPAKTYKLLKTPHRILTNFLRQGKEADSVNIQNLKEHSWATKLNNLLFIPDNRIGWWPFAYLSILENFKRNDFDLIFSTSPMFTAHLVAMAVKHTFHKPWVVDLRDLWVLNPYLRPPTALHRRICRSIESKTFRSADKIVTVADELRQDLIESYSEISPAKFVVIPNGYDQADFESASQQKDKKFSIVYVGSLYLFSGRTPYYFLVALGHLITQYPQLKQEMDVIFIGPWDRQNEKIFRNTISEYSLKNMVRHIDPVPHPEAVKYMKSARLLLLILGKKIEVQKGSGERIYDRTSATGKLFEYLASGNPILALAGEGAAKRIIEEANSGRVVDPEDIDGIKKAILQFYKLYKQGELKVQIRKDVSQRFERKKLTGELAKIFDELTDKER